MSFHAFRRRRVRSYMQAAQSPLKSRSLMGVFNERSSVKTKKIMYLTPGNEEKWCFLAHIRADICKTGEISAFCRLMLFSQNLQFSQITSKANMRKSLIFPWEILPWWHYSRCPKGGIRQTLAAESKINLNFLILATSGVPPHWFGASSSSSARFNLHYFATVASVFAP